MTAIGEEIKEIGLASSTHNTLIENKEDDKSTKFSEMSIADLVNEDPELAERLTEMGFGCVGCACSDMETLEQGIAGHGLDPQEVIKELNREKSSDPKK